MSDITAEQRNLAANSIRALAIDATNKADSGHPGAPMGLADIAVVLWGEVMRYDPAQPNWPDRDRFILSNGHASMLLYSVLHLAGYDLSMDELINFRQFGSKTPGHPEYGHTPGVETTTGPLGQGFANGIGMAIAARMTKARVGVHEGFSPVSHRIYGICGDGCLMEGVAHEAASIAGHLGLGEIVYVYDDNSITIDGNTNITFTENVPQRFEALGWHVLHCDGHDQAAVKAALQQGAAETARPTLIVAKTHIGFGSPKVQDTASAHGSPLGEDEAAVTKAKLGWTYGPFEVPDDARALFAAAARRGEQVRTKWEANMATFRANNAAGAAAWDGLLTHEASQATIGAALAAVTPASKKAARALSGSVLNAVAKVVPGLVGGSADLAGSNKTTLKDTGFVATEDFGGRNLHFGVREHGMGAIVNGMALYGGYVPYGATFLTFSDYMRPSIRLAALMKIRSLFVFTHESVYLGEDGPTHQSVEHTMALRLIPGLNVWRPADGVECAMAWAYAVERGDPAPHCLLFTRQDVTPLNRSDDFEPTTVFRGGYVLKDADKAACTIIATGSEVELAVDAAALLAIDGIATRVVSMPCMERFNAQDDAYKNAVLGDAPRVSVELGRTFGWSTLTGANGLNLGLDQFGDSAPAGVLREHYGMTPDKVSSKIRAWLDG